MTGILLVLSVFSTVLFNVVSNYVCKKIFATAGEVYAFNFFSFSVCTIIFGILMFGETLSGFTLICALIFGVVTALSSFYKLRALTVGPMHITGLITASSMIIPTLSGIFFGESFSIFKLIVVFVLIGFIYLSIGKGRQTRMSKLWYIYCVLAFVFLGAIGVIQKIHQSSGHSNEVSGFLFVAFVCSMAVSCFCGNSKPIKVHIGLRHIIPAIICGVCTFAMNYINLILSGLLPSQLFFPLVNGSAIVLSSLSAVFVFGEKLSPRQLCGLGGGIAALVAICLVP